MSRFAGSIRLRLALWYAGLLGILLIGIGGSIYLVHARTHYRQVDRSLATITDHYRGEIELELAEGVALDSALAASIDPTSDDELETNVVIYDASEQVLEGEAIAAERPLLSELRDGELHHGGTFRTVDSASGRVRVHTMALRESGAIVGYVQSAESLEDIDRSLARFRQLVALATLAGVIAATAGGIVIASRALRPIAEVTETARAISLSKGFGRRLEQTEQQDELGELARTFNQMLSSLEEAYSAQRRFVDDAAHELRAPLTSLLGNLEFLERARELPDAERQTIVGELRTEVERLARMVGELLTLARADAGQDLRRQRVDLDRLVVEAVNDTRGGAGELDVAISELMPVYVDGDPDRLRQLVIILVDNAIRYTPRGRVRIGVRRDDAENAVLTVTDTGIGIAPADISRIFDRFYRADPARTRVTEGSGLGLSIAKWISEAHGGTIAVESTVGAGTTFTVCLPLATGPATGPGSR